MRATSPYLQIPAVCLFFCLLPAVQSFAAGGTIDQDREGLRSEAALQARTDPAAPRDSVQASGRPDSPSGGSAARVHGGLDRDTMTPRPRSGALQARPLVPGPGHQRADPRAARAVTGASRRARNGASAQRTSDPEARPFREEGDPRPSAAVDDPGSVAANVAGKLVLVVALIFGCAAGWRKLQARMPPSLVPSTQMVQLKSTVPLGPQRYLHVVTFGERQLLLASAPHEVSLIATLGPDGAAESGDRAHYPDPLLQPSAPAPSASDRFEELLHRLRELEVAASMPAAAGPQTSGSAVSSSDARLTAAMIAGAPPPDRWSHPRRQDAADGVGAANHQEDAASGAPDREPTGGRVPIGAAPDRPGGRSEGLALAVPPGSLFRTAAKPGAASANA